MSSFSIRQLACFVAVAEELNFGRAGRRLHLSQPPLTRQIQSLETALNAQLFVRGTRGVKLTPAGKAFLPEARAVLARLDFATETAHRAARGQVGVLRVAYDCHSLYSVIPTAITRFRKRYPEVQVVVQELGAAEQIAAFAREDLDAGFISPPVAIAADLDLSREHLASLPCVLALPGNRATLWPRVVPLDLLRNEPFILHGRGDDDVLKIRLLAACDHAGFVPKVLSTSSSLEMVLGFVAAEAGVAILSDAARHISRNNVVYRNLDRSHSVHLDFEIMWRVNDSSDCVLNFLEIVRSIVKNLTELRLTRQPELSIWLEASAQNHCSERLIELP